MVLTLSRQFVTLTGTGKAVRVFFLYLTDLFIYLYKITVGARYKGLIIPRFF